MLVFLKSSKKNGNFTTKFGKNFKAAETMLLCDIISVIITTPEDCILLL